MMEAGCVRGRLDRYGRMVRRIGLRERNNRLNFNK